MDELSMRPLEDWDYELLLGWGKFWRFPYPPKEFLPENGLGGIMVLWRGKPACAGYIYRTDSSVCWMEWIMSSPHIRDAEVRSESLDYLIEALSLVAESLGYKWIFTSVKNERLINKYTDNGFEVGSKGTTEMIKKL